MGARRLPLALAALLLRYARGALPWSDVNVLIVTDVHSWIAGHAHPDHTPALDATYGDVLSLYERLAAAAAAEGRDLFFVQNGDLNDGTGFSTLPPATLATLLRRLPFDALTTGNHEVRSPRRTTERRRRRPRKRDDGSRFDEPRKDRPASQHKTMPFHEESSVPVARDRPRPPTT